MLLIAGTGYLLDRGLGPSGVLMLAGFATLVTLRVPWVWTATGLLVSAALILAAARVGRSGPGVGEDA